MKIFYIIFAQNIDCGYMLELPYEAVCLIRRFSLVSTIYVLSKNKKKMYIPVNLSFTILKWGVRGSTLHGHVSMILSSIFIATTRSVIILSVHITLENCRYKE